MGSSRGRHCTKKALHIEAALADIAAPGPYHHDADASLAEIEDSAEQIGEEQSSESHQAAGTALVAGRHVAEEIP
jgi:hypothetical protein